MNDGYTVYLMHCKAEGKSYVGQTTKSVKERLARHAISAKHCQRFKKTGSRRLMAAIILHGIEAFTIEPLMVVPTQEEADHWEDFFILASNTLNPQFGYNIKRGGRHSGKHSQETKDRVAQSKLGKPRPKEAMARVSATKIAQGTHRGEKHGKAILTEIKVREIKKLLAEGKNCKTIGTLFGVSDAVIRAIRNGKNWSHIK